MFFVRRNRHLFCLTQACPYTRRIPVRMSMGTDSPVPPPVATLTMTLLWNWWTEMKTSKKQLLSPHSDLCMVNIYYLQLPKNQLNAGKYSAYGIGSMYGIIYIVFNIFSLHERGRSLWYYVYKCKMPVSWTHTHKNNVWYIYLHML